jgi:hypothetical protein
MPAVVSRGHCLLQRRCDQFLSPRSLRPHQPRLGVDGSSPLVEMTGAAGGVSTDGAGGGITSSEVTIGAGSRMVERRRVGVGSGALSDTGAGIAGWAAGSLCTG